MRRLFILPLAVFVAACGQDGPKVATVESQGLSWTKVEQNVRGPWSQAQQYCESATFNGHDDWRLPALAELRALYSGQQGNFPWGNNGIDWVWSSTSKEPGSHYLLNVNNASLSWPNDSRNAWVVCVRKI